VGKPFEKCSLEGPRRRWQDNSKMDLRKIGCDEGRWIKLAQYCVMSCRTFLGSDTRQLNGSFNFFVAY
jgi:hypothetical protein